MVFPFRDSSISVGSFVWNRREFLRLISASAVSSALFPALPAHARHAFDKKKVVIVTFGGGARDEETFGPDGQANIPGLIYTLLPQSTFFGQVINRGILGHYVVRWEDVQNRHGDPQWGMVWFHASCTISCPRPCALASRRL